VAVNHHSVAASTNPVVHLWNNLSNDVISAKSLYSFKCRLSKLNFSKFSFYCKMHLVQSAALPDLGRFKVIQGQRSRCQSIAHAWFLIQLPLTPSSYRSPFSKYLMCNFSDLELGQFIVIQGQCSQCQSH